MARVSAGLLMYRVREGQLQIFLAHPGGPFFARKDEGSWTLPKGEVNPGEELLPAAVREFTEETGIVPEGPFLALGNVKTSSKVIHAWAFEHASEPGPLRSNMFLLEWPPHSGMQAEFPEIDRAAFFFLAQARNKLLRSQQPFLDRLEASLRENVP